MGNSIIGRGVRVEVEKTSVEAIAITSVSTDFPAVATKNAHGLLDGQVGYFIDVTGMVQLDGQAVRVANKTENTFELEDIDTTDWPEFTGGKFVPITAWSTIAKATSYAIGGGEAPSLDDAVLLDDIAQEVAGLLPAETLSFGLNAEAKASEGMLICKHAARKSAYKVFRITLKTGDVRVGRGQPSKPGEDVQKGAIGTGSMGVKIKGFVTEGAA